MESGVDVRATALFHVLAAREFAGIDLTDGRAVLDFGCGRGDLVRSLRDLGSDARGCDLPASVGAGEHLSPISTDHIDCLTRTTRSTSS